MDAEALAIALVGRLDQKPIAHQINALQVQRGQRFAPIALVARRAIAHGQAQNGAGHSIADAADHAPAEPPIRGCAARHIARPHYQIIVLGSPHKLGQISRIMREIGVHPDDALVAAIQGQPERLDVGCA